MTLQVVKIFRQRVSSLVKRHQWYNIYIILTLREGYTNSSSWKNYFFSFLAHYVCCIYVFFSVVIAYFATLAFYSFCTCHYLLFLLLAVGLSAYLSFGVLILMTFIIFFIIFLLLLAYNNIFLLHTMTVGVHIFIKFFQSLLWSCRNYIFYG